ncbi:hypothetical protein LTR08_005690 [Meristemomyces frigidus]|nr:hypothetical protein LTR08_005690 [Meristemomyces frigidus]
MAAPAPLLHFLRPLGLPRPATFRRFFATTAVARGETHSARIARRDGTPLREDKNLTASRSASPTYPPKSMKSLPRPKESRSSHRTKHPRPERAYPTRHPTHTITAAPTLVPAPVEPLSSDQCAPNLPYFVTRSPSNELPIYTLKKRGGNLKMTRVKKVDGQVEALRTALVEALGLPEKECSVNPITRHVMMKGHLKPQVEKFLRERMF